MKSALYAEIQKAKHRHDLEIIVAIGILVMILSVGFGETDSASGYSAFFYTIPIIQTLVMSTSMAVLASRVWDVETKGNTCKLLFTLQTRSSLYWTKAILGMIEIVIISLLECVAVWGIGLLRNYTDTLDVQRLLLLFFSSTVISLMLFLFSLLLSICFPTQVPVLAMGLMGSLFGLFSAFFPRVLIYFVPWGYYMPLSTMALKWNEVTRETKYIPRDFSGSVLPIAVLIMVICIALGKYFVDKREV